MGQFDWTPDEYLERIRLRIPRYDELQEQAVAAVPFPPERVLELGMGTGETTRRLIEAHPDAWVIGLDASPDSDLDEPQQEALFRRVRDHSRSLVIGDVFEDDALEKVVEWSQGEVTWQADGLAVVRATY